MVVMPPTYILEISMQELYKNIEYHDSTLTNLITQGDVVKLDLENVLVDGRQRKVSIILHRVQKMEIEDQEVAEVSMEGEDGVILTLDVNQDSMELIVEWHNYSPHRSIVKHCRIECTSSSVEVL